jgi:hypothetical protein
VDLVIGDAELVRRGDYLSTEAFWAANVYIPVGEVRHQMPKRPGIDPDLVA